MNGVGVSKPLRAILGIAVLVVALAVICNAVGQYRASKEAANVRPSRGTKGSGASPKPSSPATRSPRADDQTRTAAPVVRPQLVVAIEGLNFRREPKTNGSVIRGLGTGEKLTLLGTDRGWYHVRDDTGTEGWISSNPKYTTRE